MLSIVVAAALSGRVSRWLAAARPAGFVLVAGIGVVASATLTPFEGAAAGHAMPGRCDLSRIGLVPLADLFGLMDPAANIALFVPLGLAVGWLPASRRTALVLAATIAFPFAIELTQLVATGLHRQCESADVVDNLTGLALGLAAAIVARGLLRAGR